MAMRNELKTSLTLLALAISAPATAMSPLSNEELGAERGQGLLVVESIAGSGAAAGMNFMRMGLDANLSLNANIDRMQLGCGGFNESVRAGSCDIDMDYVRLMGKSPAGVDNATQVARGGNPRAGEPVTSDFVLTRPYIEIATKGTGATRELVGIKISAQETNGFFGVGYNNGGTHVGLNTFSGYMNVYLSGYVRFTTGLGGGAACIGEPAGYSACTGNPDGVLYNNSNLASASKTAFVGTRFQEIHMESVPLRNLHGAGGLLSLFSGSDMYAIMDARLKDVHGFELNGTKDFFMSFQRESVTYPNYDKSTYAVAANAGWWMNVPRVELRDLEPAQVNLGCPGFLCAGLLDAFAAPGVYAGYPDLKSNPPVNCYGSSSFC